MWGAGCLAHAALVLLEAWVGGKLGHLPLERRRVLPARAGGHQQLRRVRAHPGDTLHAPAWEELGVPRSVVVVVLGGLRADQQALVPG
ncbi:hypothetical protein V3W47_08880 [Deinococcus sp. YIM 134068]